MFNYTSLDQFDSALLYDLTDLVKGSDTGDANIPLKLLFNRTQWLKNRLGRREIKTLNGNYSFDISDLGKGFSFHISANSTFVLPDVSTLLPGTTVPITTRIPVIKALSVLCYGSQLIYDGSLDLSTMYMHDGERLVLVAVDEDNGDTPDHWEIIDADGNFKTAGQSFGVRKQPRNSIINNGCLPESGGALLVRQDMPRLWAVVNSMSSGLVSDSTWLSNPGGKPVYRGMFSLGNGTTTFRAPDERAMSDRYADLGRGIDNSRLSNAIGGYEEDSNKEHTHNISEGGDTHLDSVGKWRVIQSNADFRDADIDISLKKEGGAENIVKNISKIPVTLY